MQVTFSRPLQISILVLCVMFTFTHPKPSSAAATYRARLVVEMELNPRDPLLNIGDPVHRVYDVPPDAGEGVTFTPGGSVYAIDPAQTMYYEVECEGSAIWSGVGEAADAGGICVASGAFHITNGYPDTHTVDAHISIREFTLEGTVDVDVSELAAVELYVHLEPAEGIGRSHDNPVFSFGRSTRVDPVGTHFEIIGLPQELHIPLQIPGGEDGADPGEFIIRPFQTINLRVGIRGQAISFVSPKGVMLPLTFIPDPPKDPMPSLLLQDRIADLIDYFKLAVKDSLIIGADSSSKNLQTYSDILNQFYKEWQKNRDEEACALLLRAILQSDPAKPPMDLIAGSGVEIFQRKLLDLAKNGLRCAVSHEKSPNGNSFPPP